MNILIAGGGFAGVRLAQNLEKRLPSQSARVSLISQENFMLYTPFLPEAAAGTLEPRHVVVPLREILHRMHLRLGSITEHSPEAGEITYRSRNGEEKTLSYDRLVLSLGSVSRVLPSLKDSVMTFKSLPDAIRLRNTVIERLEEANSLQETGEIEELLTFVFVGGGYAGLEAIAELQDFAAQAISFYPAARLRGMRWVLVDSAPRVLSEIDASLASYAANQLRSRGIEIYTDTFLKEVSGKNIALSNGMKLKSRNVVWTAGVSPNPLLPELGLPLDSGGRIITDEYLNVVGHKNIWAIGDCAAIANRDGSMQPPTAQHALRQADAAAENLLASVSVGEQKKYRYVSHNAFVNLGRYKAVGRIGRMRFSGALAWWMARTYHLSQIPSMHRKWRAVLDWTVGLFFHRDLADLGSLQDDER